MPRCSGVRGTGENSQEKWATDSLDTCFKTISQLHFYLDFITIKGSFKVSMCFWPLSYLEQNDKVTSLIWNCGPDGEIKDRKHQRRFSEIPETARLQGCCLRLWHWCTTTSKRKVPSVGTWGCGPKRFTAIKYSNHSAKLQETSHNPEQWGLKMRTVCASNLFTWNHLHCKCQISSSDNTQKKKKVVMFYPSSQTVERHSWILTSSEFYIL